MVVLFRFVLILVLIALPFKAFAAGEFLDIKEIESKGGIKAWLVEDHSIPVVSLHFSFLGAGSAQDPADKQGLAQLASNTMDEGAGELDDLAFQKRLRDLAITLRYSSGRDHFSGHVKTLTRNKDEAFRLLRLSLTQPRFDKAPVARMREANQSRIRRSLADPDWKAARLMNDVAYAGHPYALNSGGTLSTLEAITPQDLKGFVKERLARGNLVVSAAGDITAEALSALLDEIFGALPERAQLEDVADLTLQNQGKTYLYEQDVPQSVISIQQPGIAKDDPDYFTAQVLNQILGASGFGSRLMKEVREERGLTYGIYSSLYNLDHINTLSVSTSTKNESAGEVLGLVAQEFEMLRKEPVSDKELADAQSYLIGALPLALTSTDKISGLLLSLQQSDLPIDYFDKRQQGIEATSKEDILRVAKDLLDPAAFVTVLVGKPEGVTPDQKVEALPNVE